jgi:hypothetical protein
VAKVHAPHQQVAIIKLGWLFLLKHWLEEFSAPKCSFQDVAVHVASFAFGVAF